MQVNYFGKFLGNLKLNSKLGINYNFTLAIVHKK